VRPQTRYATVGEAAVAYQVLGDGPGDLVVAPPVYSHMDLQWEERHFAAFLERLASFSRLILFDKRGTGLSDPLPRTGAPTLEERMDDMIAVMDAVGCKRAALFGYGEGGPTCILFAATYPDRTTQLVLCNTAARLLRAEDYPWGWEPSATPMDEALADYANPDLEVFYRSAPSHMNDPGFRDWWIRLLRASAPPGVYRALQRVAMDIDIRRVLPTLSMPTLVMHRADNRIVEVGNGRYLAERIPGARFVELPGADHHPWMGPSEPVLEEIQEFLTGTRPSPEHDRVLATVLVTDIVGSTERAAALGDRRWREVLEEQRAVVRLQLERFRGREIDTAGDGFLCTFDGPARAIRCALAVVECVRPLGLEVRAGLHTGECEMVGDGIAGIAVHIGARVAALAQPGEVLVTSTVRDLVAGSGIRFADRGEHALKGVPDPWRIFAAEGA
jgi:pimeloyl-ACP methyl ester carboxylesterase